MSAATGTSSIKASAEKPVLLIDASIYIFQYYFSLPDHWFSRKEQWPTAAVYGYTTFLIKVLKTQQPQRIAACFDESLDQCFRNDIYEDYKSSRALPDEALAFQLKACRKITELLGITCFSSKRYEADDLLGSLYQRCQRSKKPIAILTRDKDLGQLIKRPQDYLWDYAKDIKMFDGDIEEKFGVKPDQIVDYLALVGDSIDDIPGVPGIGKKTAQQLLQNFYSVNQLLNDPHAIENISIRGSKRIVENLQEYDQQIRMAQQLATIVKDLPLIDRITELNKQPIALKKVERFCQQMGFSKLYKTISDLNDLKGK